MRSTLISSASTTYPLLPRGAKPPRDAAEGTGGGIRVGPANVTLENTIVSGNTAANGAGTTVAHSHLDQMLTALITRSADNHDTDGQTINDIVIAADCKSLQLRAERKGDGNGRVYVVTLRVTDTSGNVSTATAKVGVPNSQNGSVAVNDGPSFTVTSNCP